MLARRTFLGGAAALAVCSGGARADTYPARDDALHRHYEPGLIGDDVRKALATDPMAYGIKGSRKVLETITQYVHEQGLAARRVALEELFAPSTMET